MIYENKLRLCCDLQEYRTKINFVNIFPTSKWNYFRQRIYFILWQEILICDRNSFTFYIFLFEQISPPTHRHRHAANIPPCDRNFFLSQLNSSCHMKFLPEMRNFFLWQYITSCDIKYFIRVIFKFSWQSVVFPPKFVWGLNISSCDRKFLPPTENFFLW